MLFSVYRCVLDELLTNHTFAAVKNNAACQCELNNSLVMKHSL